LRLKKEIKAISTLLVILLVLVSLIVGGLLSYMWVISSYYYESSGTDLIITDALFPLDQAGYFNLTVMNPSHSSTTNITDIYIKAADNTTVQAVTHIYRETLPITIERATSKKIVCVENWSPFAGKSITVGITTSDNTGASKTVITQFVGLETTTDINPLVSSKQFNITVTNPSNSTLNLTLSNVLINQVPVLNATPTLPLNLTVGSRVKVQCVFDFEGLSDPVIRVETAEGYYADLSTNVVTDLGWNITQVLFNGDNPEDMNITIFNPDTAGTYVDINEIELVYGNTTSYINGSLTSPSFVPYYRLEPGDTVTFGNCTWDWRDYRSQNVTVNVYNLQEFAAASVTVLTPEPINFKITGVNFNLADTKHFAVNMTNVASSTDAVIPAQISLGGSSVGFASQAIPIGETRQFNCTFDWSSLRGTTATVDISTASGLYSSRSVTLPSVDLTISDTIDFNETAEGFLYVNVTITNSAFSTRSVTITEITFTTPNSTDTINGTTPRLVPNGYPLAINAKVALICPWYWQDYYDQTLTVTVKTAEEFSATRTFQTPASTP